MDYEITQKMINLIDQHEVKLDVKDAELLIDCWEKVAINDKKQDKKTPKERFKQIHKDK